MLDSLTTSANLGIAAVVTLDDSADTRSRLADIHAVAAARAVRVEVVASATEAYESVISVGPAVVFVAGWYRIIPDSVLRAIPQGFIGIHYSLLPSFRGAAPVVWALINGESEVGYSIFKTSTGMDEGLLAAQGKIALDGNEYIDEVLDSLDLASMRTLSEVADAVASGTHPMSSQHPVGLSYAGARVASDGRIDWTSTSDQIARFVRAQSRPYPGAFGFFRSKQVTIWRARSDPSARYFGAPGQIVRVTSDGPVVACGGGTGLILEESESSDPDIHFGIGSARFS